MSFCEAVFSRMLTYIIEKSQNSQQRPQVKKGLRRLSKSLIFLGSPNGDRTRVSGVRER